MHDIIRALAFLVGLVILGAIAHVTITSTGSYGQPSAATVIALALGVAVGAVAIGASLAQGRRVLAAGLIIALLAGEAFGLLRTADMYVASREAQQAPIRDAAAKHTAALARLAAAERSDAVAKAEASKAKITSEAMAASVEKTCRDNCRLVLEAQVSDAQAVVQAARTAQQREIVEARAELHQNPMPASASPLADRLGVPAWGIDLVIAGLGSIGCNGLAACLLAFAAHAPRRGQHDLGQPRKFAVAPDLGRPRPAVEVLEPRLGDIDAFMLERVTRIRGAQVSWAELFAEYLDWCRAESLRPVTVENFGKRMDAMRRELKLRTHAAGDDVFFVGLGIKRLRLIAS
jgi:hypothetical protein